jgi:hypothetical protein
MENQGKIDARTATGWACVLMVKREIFANRAEVHPYVSMEGWDGIARTVVDQLYAPTAGRSRIARSAGERDVWDASTVGRSFYAKNAEEVVSVSMVGKRIAARSV